MNVIKYMSFKLLITVIFLSCLLHQTYLLIKQYLEYNTFINIKFTSNIINALPAITVCYNRLYSFEKLVQYYPDYKIDYENYLKFLSKYYSGNQISRKDRNSFLTENKFHMQKYWEIIENNFIEPYFYSFNNLSTEQIFELTLGFQDLNSTDYQYENNRIINVYLFGENNVLDGFSKSNSSNRSIFELEPIESVYNRRERFKCFIFLDEIQIPSSINKMNVNFMRNSILEIMVSS